MVGCMKNPFCQMWSVEINDYLITITTLFRASYPGHPPYHDNVPFHSKAQGCVVVKPVKDLVL